MSKRDELDDIIDRMKFATDNWPDYPLSLDPVSEALLSNPQQHPVYVWLGRFIDAYPAGSSLHDGARALISAGRPFVRAARPRSFGLRPVGKCFRNAMRVARADRARYVEGFATIRNHLPVHHGWITLDGVHAIDVTWRDTVDAFYFGIPFATKEVFRAMVKRDAFQPMIDVSWNWGAGE